MDTKLRGESILLKTERINENNFKDIPNPCIYCLYWQTSGPFNENKLKPEMEQKKREWFNRVNGEFGSCIKIAYLNNIPIGFIQYAPAKFFPRAKKYAAGPPSKDAVFLACIYITTQEARGKGLGTTMLKDLINELKEKEFKAVETFARKSSENNPSGPLKFYLKQNFQMKNDKDDFPLVRLEL